MASTLLTVAQVRAHVETELSDSAFERLIDSQDARIRRMVGPHDGTLTVDNYRTDGLHRIWLPRPAETVTSVEERYETDATWTTVDSGNYYLSDEGNTINRTDTRFLPLAKIVYEPVAENDLRMQALIDLVRLRVADDAMASHTDGDFSATSVDYAREERRILEPLRHRDGGAGLLT